MNSNKRFPAKSSDMILSTGNPPRSKLVSRIIDKVMSLSLFHCIRFATELDWLKLPHDVLSLIIDKVICFSLSDYIRFGVVCSKWRRFCLENYEHMKIPNRTPILVKLPLNDNDDDDDGVRLEQSTESFYTLSERKGYYFKLSVPIYTNCRGSNFGWIITETDNDIFGIDISIRLLNPFRSVNNEIQIPSTRMFWDKLGHHMNVRVTKSIKKAVLSTSPSSNPNDFILVAIYSDNTMGFYKSGNKGWTFVEHQLISKCQDVVYYKGQFFIHSYDGSVLVLDSRTLNSDEPKFDVITGKPPMHMEQDDDIKWAYFVESASGDLLLVYRLYLNKTTVDFQVFKLVEYTKWVRVNTLEGHILFLSKNGSMSVSASDLPGSKPNCIYFTGLQIVRDRPSFDQFLEGGHHMGIFDLEDRSFDPHYLMKSRDSMIALNWIQPSL